MAGESQTTSRVAMIRPACFGSNPDTLATNRFQRAATLDRGIAATARAEFDGLVEALTRCEIEVRVFEGRSAPVCPDEVFPNNWFSTHADGSLVLYPMMVENRRLERRDDVIKALAADSAAPTRIVDLTGFERDGRYLEGTGSLVLDRVARLAYACRSPRTDGEAARAFAARLGYEAVLFDALDARGQPVYHSNVMMSVGESFAVICAEALRENDREAVIGRLEAANKGVIKIGLAELEAFAGNLLELRGPAGPVIALSAQALAALSTTARRALESRGQLLPVDVRTIETYGGGSVRCMLAEDHLSGIPPHITEQSCGGVR